MRPLPVQRSSGPLGRLPHVSSQPPKIDFQQGDYNMCQPLAAMLSLDRWLDSSRTEAGEAYLASMMQGPDTEGNFIVKFPGYAHPITVTKQQLNDSRLAHTMTSTDNSRVMLIPVLEAAALQLQRHHHKTEAFSLLLGDQADIFTIPGSRFGDEFSRYLIDQSRGGNDLIMTAITINPRTIMTAEQPPRRIPLAGLHTCSIYIRDGQYYLINPWNTSDVHEISLKTIRETFNRVNLAAPPGQHFALPPHLEIAEAARHSHAAFKRFWESTNLPAPFGALKMGLMWLPVEAADDHYRTLSDALARESPFLSPSTPTSPPIAQPTKPDISSPPIPEAVQRRVRETVNFIPYSNDSAATVSAPSVARGENGWAKT
jgi:hypothetical protein